MQTTSVSQFVNAPRAAVYRVLLDPAALARWRVPDGMTSQVHEFEAREGGYFRVSLTYDLPGAVGKSAAHTDTYHGYFRSLVPDEQVVEVFEFETTNPALAGTMTMTTTLTNAVPSPARGHGCDAVGGVERAGDLGVGADRGERGTYVQIVHQGLPDDVSAADNELGTRMALANLARLVESTAP